MAEINDLSVTDALNVARFPENQAPSSVNDGARALEGIIARWQKDTNASITAGGTGDVITVAANQTLSAYYDGLVIAFEAAAANTGAATLNVDSVGAATIKKNHDQDLAANDIETGQKVIVIYDGTNWQMVSHVANAPLVSADIGSTVQGYNAGISSTPHTQGKHAIPFLARSMAPTTTNGCASVARAETTTNKINYEYLAFDAAAEEHAFLAFRAPKSSDETAGIYVYGLQWAEAASATAHAVVWEFEALALGDGETLDTAVGTAVTVTDTGAAGKINIAPDSAAITPANTWAEGDWLYIQISRKAADASDTLDVDAHLIGGQIIITTNAGNDA